MTTPAIARRWREPPAGPGLQAALRRDVAPLLRRAPLAALLISGLVFHVAVAPHLAVPGLEPDVVLVVVVAVAARRGERAGGAFGFAAGLGVDLFQASPLGTSALAYTLLGQVLGRLSGPPPAALRQSVGVVFLGVAAGRLVAAVVATALGGVPFPDADGLLRIAGVAALSAPLAPAAVAVVRRLGGDSGVRP